jgi:hypothetical protein
MSKLESRRLDILLHDRASLMIQRRTIKTLSAFMTALVLGTAGSAQVQTGSISGRVTVGGQPVQGVILLLQPRGTTRQKKAVTDSEGRYRISGIPPGSYRIEPSSPTLILPQTDSGSNGKLVIIGNGEQIEALDLELVAGSVITGRVVRSDGKPVVEEEIQLKRTDNKPIPGSYSGIQWRTDDRGIYRIYGLRSGSYLVSAGYPEGGVGEGHYPQVFYPSVLDEKSAKPVELSAGEEKSGIDIRVEPRPPGFRVSGSAVDADTGQPVAAAMVWYGVSRSQSTGQTAMTSATGRPTDQAGSFSFEEVAPGHYTIYTRPAEGGPNAYSDGLDFDVGDSDVKGLVLKVNRGATISGVVVIESGDSSIASVGIVSLRLGAITYGGSPSRNAACTPAADGTFQLRGVIPGKTRLLLNRSGVGTGSYVLMRVERGGKVSTDGTIDVLPGENIDGIRVIVGYGTGIIRGVVTLTDGGSLGEWRIQVLVRLASPSVVTWNRYWDVDGRGQFIIEGLVSGEYQLVVIGSKPQSQASPASRFSRTERMVTVTNGATSNVTLTVDLRGPQDQ